MGFFGKNEAELNQIADGLEKHKTELNNLESALKSAQSNHEHERRLLEEAKMLFEKERETFRAETAKNCAGIASERAELEKDRIELSKRRAEAAAGFVKEQRELFKDLVEKRNVELDGRQQELEEWETRLCTKQKDLLTAEGEMARRELAVTEREQKADAGFADKAKALADEAARQFQANQAEATRLRTRADAIAEERQTLEVTKGELTQRERDIIAAEHKRDAGFADERAGLNIEMREKRSQLESEIAAVREQKLSALEEEIGKFKTKRLEEITEAEQTERHRIHAEIAYEKETWMKQQRDARKTIEAERTEFERQKGVVSALQSELEGRKRELEANEKTLERKEQRLEQQWQKRNAQLDDAIETGGEERRKSFEASEAASKKENNRLRETLRIQTELCGVLDQLQRQLGGKDAAEILRELNGKTDELKRLREELATRPTEEMRERYKTVESESQRRKARIDELEKQINANATTLAETSELRRRNSELERDHASKSRIAENYSKDAERLQAELDRLRAAYERPAEVAARYKEIEMPHVKADRAKQPVKAEIDEITWLSRIGEACVTYGLHFNPRILKAFHTALKTAEWSPLTVLAGVSGTGKSELPRLYSHFGGLMFEPLSVQPNWDSQESMLGFFNSIDNKFDAQPVLRFLAQSQKPWIDKTTDDDGYPGLQDAVCLVLLDEMNLAHPELYFAEFLSKLELRRGMKGTDVPFLPVKIGAGMQPYELRLGRNVLWTGTMNQDETTKSLSDKVLDRSIIIHFPRPTGLKRRLKLSPLDEKNRGPLLHKGTWQKWLAQGSSFSDDDVKPFKEFVEKMNGALAVVGRAIGHRVWQSVEYYMANYPDVCAAQKANDKGAIARALHVAFEDQLVQKVMPKLRGIDTRGKSKTECLDKILAQINAGIGGNPFNLVEDFDLSCELGHGQFIWQTANYLKEAEGSALTVSTSADSAEVSSKPSAKPTDPKSL